MNVPIQRIAFIQRKIVDKQSYSMHPRGYLNLRVFLARALTSIIKSSFGCLAKGLVTNQTMYALRHLRRLARLHSQQACQTTRYCSAIVTHISAIQCTAR